MDDLVPPVVTAKPVRGREMVSNVVPTDIFDPITGRKATMPVEPGEKLGKGEVYHQGYVDGKLFLVPDSNLEAMKGIINFKMRPRKSTRYKHQTSYEISDYEHFRGRLNALIEKLGSMGPESESEAEEEEDEEKKASTKVVFGDLEREQSKVRQDTKDEEQTEGKGEPSEEIVPEKEEESEIKDPEETKHCFRFLISGHFNSDKTPMYIIQEYDGPNLFNEQKPDLFSSTTDKEVDITISGRFFNKNILEEFQGKPVALNTTTKRILIDENKSKIHNDSFNEVYKFKAADIHIKGEFIRNEGSNEVTPLLTLRAKKKLLDNYEVTTPQKSDVEKHNAHDAEPRNCDNQDPQEGPGSSRSGSNQVSPAVLLYKPKCDSPFSRSDLREEQIIQMALERPISIGKHSFSSSMRLGPPSVDSSQTKKANSIKKMFLKYKTKRKLLLEEKFSAPVVESIILKEQSSLGSIHKAASENKQTINRISNTNFSEKEIKLTGAGVWLFKIITGNNFYKSFFKKKKTEGKRVKYLKQTQAKKNNEERKNNEQLGENERQNVGNRLK